MKEPRITVIRLSSLGDVAMMVPVLISFHRAYPSHTIKIISRERYRFIFQALHFTEFIAIDNGNTSLNFIELLRFAIQQCMVRNHLVIDLHSVLRTHILEVFFRSRGNKIFKIDKGRAEKRALISMKGQGIYPLKTTHERYRDVFEKAGYPFELAMDAFYPKVDSAFNEKRIGIAPFSRHRSKEYSLEKMRLVLIELSKMDSVQILIFGNGKLEEVEVEKMTLGLKNVKNLVQRVSFEEELKQIAQLDVMLSMDSGNGHLAAMYGIPVITLWGTTHPYLGFASYRQPFENFLFPDKKQYPNLPISIFGKSKDKVYENAINSIEVSDIIKKLRTIIG